MSGYREQVNRVAKETAWTFWRFLGIFLVVVVVMTAIIFGLRALGVFGSTAVERAAFEQSYQRSEAIRSQIATDEAAIAEIQGQLANPGLDKNTRYNLEAQARAIRVRLAAVKGK